MSALYSYSKLLAYFQFGTVQGPLINERNVCEVFI